MNTKLIIELLDDSLGHSVQTWEIDSAHSVQIGRSPDSDVSIRNPYVSRCHACIVPKETGWVLNGISSQGVIHEDQIIQSIDLYNDIVIRLSRRGPLLRISIGSEQGESKTDDLIAMSTIAHEDFAVPLLFLDKDERDQEVAEIEKADYFSSLKGIAQQLRAEKINKR